MTIPTQDSPITYLDAQTMGEISNRIILTEKGDIIDMPLPTTRCVYIPRRFYEKLPERKRKYNYLIRHKNIGKLWAGFEDEP